MRARLTIATCTALVLGAAAGLGALILYRIVQAIAAALP